MKKLALPLIMLNILCSLIPYVVLTGLAVCREG